MREPKRRGSRAAASAAEAERAPAAAERPAPVRDARGRFLVRRDAATVARPKAIRRRKPAKPVRWSAKREGVFLAKLADTANVAASIRASGFSETTVYRRRRDDEAFRGRWAAALREGVANLETMLLERALNGVEKPIWYGGKQVGTMKEYSDRLALALLAFHRDGGGKGFGRADPVSTLSDAEQRVALKAKLSEMNVRMGGAG